MNKGDYYLGGAEPASSSPPAGMPGWGRWAFGSVLPLTAAAILLAGCGQSKPAAPVKNSAPAPAGREIRVSCSSPALYRAVTEAEQEGSGVLVLSSNCTYLLTTGPLVLTGEIELTGGPSTRLAAGANFRVVEAKGKVTIRNLLITGGRPAGDDASGGGID